MMAQRIRSLEPAAQVAHNQEDQAAQELADFQRRLLEHQERLEQLLRFRQEYQDQLNQVGQAGMSTRQLKGFSSFLDSLEVNIQHAQRQLALLMDEFQRKRKQWVSSHARTQALESMLSRLRQEQYRLQDKREQAEHDEQAQRLYRRLDGH